MNNIITKSQIAKALQDNQITIEDLKEIISKNDSHKKLKKTTSYEFVFNTESILSFVGGGILLLGITILIGANWSSFGSVGQIVITLGSGVFIALSSIFIQPILKKTIFLYITQIIASFLLLIGVMVFVSNIESHINQSLLAAVCLGYLSIVYGAMDWLFKKGIFTLQWLGFGTLSYGLIVNYFISQNYEIYSKYRAGESAWLICSVLYLLIAWRLWKGGKTFVKALILNVGAIWTMMSLFSLVQDYNSSYITNIVDKNKYYLIAQHIYGLIFIAFYYLAERIKSKVLLLSTSIGLFVWLMYMINVTYGASNNLGVSLIVSGLVLMGVGYQTFSISKRFKKR